MVRVPFAARKPTERSRREVAVLRCVVGDRGLGDHDDTVDLHRVRDRRRLSPVGRAQRRQREQPAAATTVCSAAEVQPLRPRRSPHAATGYRRTASQRRLGRHAPLPRDCRTSGADPSGSMERRPSWRVRRSAPPEGSARDEESSACLHLRSTRWRVRACESSSRGRELCSRPLPSPHGAPAPARAVQRRAPDRRRARALGGRRPVSWPIPREG